MIPVRSKMSINDNFGWMQQLLCDRNISIVHFGDKIIGAANNIVASHLHFYQKEKLN